jgi:hypothetical protein
MRDEERSLTTADLAGTDRPHTGDPGAGDPGAGEPDANEGAEREPPEGERLEPLLAGEDAERYRTRWHELQASFVDEPRKVVELADGLVAELMQKLAESFAQERSSLEDQWSRGEEVSTEDLRVALQRYRSFFDRLLAT